MSGLHRDLDRIRRESAARARARRRVHAVRRERSADDRPAWLILITEMGSLCLLIAVSLIWFVVIAAIIQKVMNF